MTEISEIEIPQKELMSGLTLSVKIKGMRYPAFVLSAEQGPLYLGLIPGAVTVALRVPLSVGFGHDR